MENIKERNEMLSWSIFMGSMFVGMGIGMIFDHMVEGMFIGFGVGYIAEAIIEGRAKNDATPNP